MNVSGSVPVSVQVSDENVGRMMAMDGEWVALLILVILGFLVWMFVRWAQEHLNKEKAFTEWRVQNSRQERDQRERREEEERLEELNAQLEERVRRAFHVKLETVHEPTTQDEIIRIMDLLAFCAADACVNQDKALRGEAELARGKVVADHKLRWAYSRDLVLQIAPELADRMPHFSEFEPLKSYREEHLRRKAEAKKNKS